MGLAYNEFGYNEHLSITSNIFSQKTTPLINNNVKKFGYNEYYGW